MDERSDGIPRRGLPKASSRVGGWSLVKLREELEFLLQGAISRHKEGTHGKPLQQGRVESEGQARIRCEASAPFHQSPGLTCTALFPQGSLLLLDHG